MQHITLGGDAVLVLCPDATAEPRQVTDNDTNVAVQILEPPVTPGEEGRRSSCASWTAGATGGRIPNSGRTAGAKHSQTIL